MQLRSFECVFGKVSDKLTLCKVWGSEQLGLCILARIFNRTLIVNALRVASKDRDTFESCFAK